MKIPELIRRARVIDPTLSIEIADSTLYSNSTPGKRHVMALVSSAAHGEGSGEEILLVMRGDEVVDLTVGRSTRHWQAAALVQAFRDGEIRGFEA